ncbi:protein FAR1-RELATED SEQUENCE 6-like [Phalaenopsis equestris]|uniref:protein FAR1-RELATED SEQUENCE 6-like n=1 Tax=Phalaenopsis equestris TaxID=78828 RepID=UPI0009E5D635|nr:protein FAR1-RELATED SEQUENCE 6-like [Phalaenopsis equestris]
MDHTMWHFVSDGEGEDTFPANREQVDVKVELDESEAKCRDESANILLETVVHNDKEAYGVYCAYAHHIGFSVRKEHDTFWPNSKNLKMKDFVCGRAGFKKELKATQIVKYKRADTRSGCPTMIRDAVDVEGNWTIKKFIESHNHSLANTGDKHLLRSSRKISEVNAEVLKSMTQSEIRPRDAFNFLATKVGELRNWSALR